MIPGLYLDSVDELAVDVERGHAVLQHAFAHHQHQVVPLALSDQLAAAEASAAGQDLIEGGFFARLIRCLMEAGREREARGGSIDESEGLNRSKNVNSEKLKLFKLL